ncbi:MAG: dihydrodipicolinate synthase family protein, partial [Betaproteobacteria bacterium]|nr:dihydrodipicolinate synthase family protein [Betaproteobacteria bacterium]
MVLTIALPAAGGKRETYSVREPRAFAKPSKPFTRVAYAAAHVVADPLSTKDPWLEAAIDWEATLAYRRHLWSWGFGIAESMDTAQRGMGLDWTNSLELVRRTLAEAGPGQVVASGAGTDHLP